jgi:hypothetical protein
MLSVVMLKYKDKDTSMLNVRKLSVYMMTRFTKEFIMLSVVMPNVVEPVSVAIPFKIERAEQLEKLNFLCPSPMIRLNKLERLLPDMALLPCV